MDFTVFDKPGAKVKLDNLSEKPPKGVTQESVAEQFEKLGQELFDLQDLLWGARQHGVLVILQGRDTAGKDGAIKHVVGCLNPRGVHVTSFGVPTQEELEHDFLWRIHHHAPRRGEFAIFNRSHYEDVLVTRVHELVPKSLWKARYQHIQDFETLLSEHGTIILKFFLHISRGEQKKRLLKREEDPRTAWKLSAGDWEDRELWDGYTDAYEEAISRTSTEQSPWIIVPSDAKWYRNLVVARALADALRPHRKAWQKHLDDEGKSKRTELEAWRKGQRK